ncbi:MAG TPA: bifunctional 2-keto-4-hydroxyglutarate aldolase/2-keto-3-deoxy-6-phosphogluconate aldolase [Candidatus Acidoferrum sp.]|nr:bifunctional 2-keto-4-hydroxyglutarate aldolase/2-keto-3-deoxy-6-phosphogluconate aldolase [Candidatus Acidoferrum sp.]
MTTPKLKVVEKVIESGLVAIVRAESAEQAGRIVEACAEGGAAAIEVTFTVPGALDVISSVAETARAQGILLGAGTVLDPETGRAAILAGAQFIVSPSINLETARLCNRYQVPYMPGAATIKEIIEAMECGADIVKLFPGELFGPSFIKAARAPLPQASLMPTGGVSLENVEEWIEAGSVAVGVGGSLTAGAKKGDYASVTRVAKEFIARIRTARNRMKEKSVF